MRGKYVGHKPLRRLAWAWIEYIEREPDLDELYKSLREVVGDDLWPDAREVDRMRPLWAELDGAS